MLIFNLSNEIPFLSFFPLDFYLKIWLYSEVKILVSILEFLQNLKNVEQ